MTGSIDRHTHQAIVDRLADIEEEYGVRVLYACEAGSRAWGFPSKDSDYDVRFIYVKPQDHYLSLNIENKRDVIEWMSSNRKLDFVGWDLRKCLKLMLKSNPALSEWLMSPVIYKAVEPFDGWLRVAAEETYSRKSAHYHYINMAKNNFHRWLATDSVRFKKYLYVLRSLMAVDYISTHDNPPPVNYFELITECNVPAEVKERVTALVERKANAEGLGEMPRDDVLHEYITNMLEWGKPEYPVPSRADLDKLFTNVLWRIDHEAKELASDHERIVRHLRFSHPPTNPGK
jgi:predicted nucleotidyltransferase